MLSFAQLSAIDEDVVANVRDVGSRSEVEVEAMGMEWLVPGFLRFEHPTRLTSNFFAKSSRAMIITTKPLQAQDPN